MTDEYDEQRANGVTLSVLIDEHAIMREALRALVVGKAKAYCRKYELDYDDVYCTPEDAVYERADRMCYLHIDEGDLGLTRLEQLKQNRKKRESA